MAQAEPRKIDLAILASVLLCSELMTPQDRCCVASFSNSYTVHQGFTNSSGSLVSALKSVHDNVGGGTSLYEALRRSSNYFRTNGRRDAVWIMIVVTDGNDDDSSVQAATRYGAEIGAVFAHPTNFGFLLGVGSDVNTSRLETCAKASKLDALPVESFAMLTELFKHLVLQVQRQVQGIAVVGDEVGAMLIRNKLSVTRIPIDIMLVLDVSGSMDCAA